MQFVGILGIVLSIVSLAAAIYDLRTRRVRRLTCEFATPALVDFLPEVIRGTAREKLIANFGEQQLTELSVIQATIRNDGTEPILFADIEEPISFEFPSGVRLLASESVEQSPRIKVISDQSPGSEPALDWRFQSLNPGEQFTLQFILEGSLREQPKVSARIIGIPSGIGIAPKNEDVLPMRRVFSVVGKSAFALMGLFLLWWGGSELTGLRTDLAGLKRDLFDYDAIPVGVENANPFVYGDGVAFGLGGGQDILAPMDGVVKVADGEISLYTDQARGDGLTYRLIRGRASATLSPVVKSGERVTKSKTISAKVLGQPFPAIVLGVEYFKDGKPVLPPARARRFSGLGEEVFVVYCAGCHALNNGNGNEVGPPSLRGLKDRRMLRHNKPNTLENIMMSLREGNPGMPPFQAGLSQDEMQAVAQFIRSQ
jgi:hypothetical protein